MAKDEKENKIKKLREDLFPGPRQVAFLVDGDNLTGHNWANLLERANDFGHLAMARLYMDFQSLNDGGLSARVAGFEPIHVLGKRSVNGYKSMVDVALATDAMSVLYENPNITMLILGTGDADFIPLIRHWRRRGKAVIVMSNDAKLSGELRRVADEVVIFQSGKAAAKKAESAAKLSEAKLRELILSVSGATRLNDRETNLPIVRVDWILEQIVKAHPEWEDALPDEESLADRLVELPEFEPIDGKGRTFLFGNTSKPSAAEAPSGKPSSSEVLEVFAELCREVLPADSSWIPASVVLNEGKRLLEDGAGLELPASRPTGWFRALMERTDGVDVKMTERGHMQLRRSSNA